MKQVVDMICEKWISIKDRRPDSGQECSTKDWGNCWYDDLNNPESLGVFYDQHTQKPVKVTCWKPIAD